MRALRARDGRRVVALGLVALCAGSLALRVVVDGPNVWIDEAISAGVASKPLAEIPRVLLEDGAPPLYYVLLHFWISAFGDGARALHGMSTLFAIACVPAAFWAVGPLGRRSAWVAATVAALGPYLTRYADEARMYTLVALLSIVATGALARLLARDGRRRDVALFALSLTGLLYAHNWALFFAAATLAGALVALARVRPEHRRALAVRAGSAFALVGLAYLPWLPSLVRQARHTGAPWSGPPPPDAVGDVVKTLAGAALFAPLTFAVAAGLIALARGSDGAGRAAARSAGVVLGATILVALLAVARHPGWAPRYYGVALGPVVLLVAAGTARAGRVGLLALAVSALPWLTPPARDPDAKSNVATIAGLFRAQLRPGDLVIATQPEQVATLRYLLGPGLRYASLLGRTPDPSIMDWRDVVARLDARGTAQAVLPEIGRLAPGARVLLVRPTGGVSASGPRYIRIVQARSEHLDALLASDPRLETLAYSSLGARDSTTQVSSVEARLYARAAPGT